MTFVSVLILKTHETTDDVVYAFGNPPHKVLGHVKIYKSNGKTELLDIEDKKYERNILPYVIKALDTHYNSGEFPEKTFYHA